MSKITIWIPSMPQKSYAYRRGDAQIIHDDNKNAIVIDGGEDFLCDQIIKYCKNHGITNITYILSHWHYDHDRGMKLLLDSSLVVDKIYCPPPSDLNQLRDSDARDDYSRAMQRIAQAKNLKKSIVYPEADKNTRIKVGTIVCDIWRRSVRPSENVDYQVNNTSLVCYFPELYYMTSGDTINAVNSFLANKYGPIKVFKIPHHGNACTNEATSRLADLGAEVCWYNHAEAYGTSIGGDEFSHWGALYCKNKGFICLRPFHEITMVAANKTLTITQNGSKWTYSIPYTGVVPEGWVHNQKGWWYQFSDGSWATGWKKLTKGEKTGWYFFNTSGYMQTGWVKVNGYWYFLDQDGLMLTGWIEYKNRKCYLEPEPMKNQGHAYMSETAVIDGKTYRFDSNCYAEEVKGDVVPSGRPDIKQNSEFKGYNVSNRNDPIMYIAVHYVGAEGTAKENLHYFSTQNRNASADYFVDHDGTIYQYNPDIKRRYSWHCGGGRQSSRGGSLYGVCKNANSIGIELCCKKVNGVWHFNDATVKSAATLVKYLMEEYGVPASRICRHFDVNGKYCPNVPNWLEPSSEWDMFKASLAGTVNQIYRVRKSWTDSKSQLGAFKSLSNARELAEKYEGYYVFDSSGNKM